MHSIAIILGDNDFGSTFRHLLSTVREVVLIDKACKESDPNYHKSLTKETIERIVYEGIRFHYVAFQNQYRYKNQDPSFHDHFAGTEEYILSGLRILFDEAADTACLNEDHDSGAWYIDITSGQITYF